MQQKQLLMPFNTVIIWVSFTGISNPKIFYFSPKKWGYLHLKLPILDWHDYFKRKDQLRVLLVVHQDMLLQRYCNNNHMVRSVITGALALLHLSFFQGLHLFTKRIILLCLSKSKVANTTLMLRHGMSSQMRQKTLFAKYS